MQGTTKIRLYCELLTCLCSTQQGEEGDVCLKLKLRLIELTDPSELPRLQSDIAALIKQSYEIYSNINS